ncbi:hypothetical protein MASR2M70_22350 [Bacillota bacterium]
MKDEANQDNDGNHFYKRSFEMHGQAPLALYFTRWGGLRQLVSFTNQNDCKTSG